MGLSVFCSSLLIIKQVFLSDELSLKSFLTSIAICIPHFTQLADSVATVQRDVICFIFLGCYRSICYFFSVFFKTAQLNK